MPVPSVRREELRLRHRTRDGDRQRGKLPAHGRLGQHRTSKGPTIGWVTMVLLAALLPSRAAGQPKPEVDLNCCYGQKPKCESYCPIMDAKQRESCLRDCEGRLRMCLTQGVFDPRQPGENVMCFKRPGVR